MAADKYAAQKKLLSQKKQLRVWFDADEYENFKSIVKSNGDTIYNLIHTFVKDYISANSKSET